MFVDVGLNRADGIADETDVMRVGRRCFISNLAWRTSWQDLKDAFRDCGTVVYSNVIRDEGGEWAPAELGPAEGPDPASWCSSVCASIADLVSHFRACRSL